LHDWDERFHALVAKNLSHHWLCPTLIDKPLLPADYKNWSTTHIWLHKQPVFLWQMALSIRFFGINEFAVRFPSLLMTTALIPVIYGIAKNLFDERTAFVSALIFSCYQPVLELNSGLPSTDHNDIAFLFYVTLSVYCWTIFEKHRQTKYLLSMGFFSGLAILNKWLPGLFIFLAFGCYHLFFLRDLFTKDTLLNIVKAMLVCLITFLPWQLYILYRFPQEALVEYHYNDLHFMKAVEGHEGNMWYYIDQLKDQYKHLQLFILIGMAYSLVQFNKYKMALSLAFAVIFVYVFFSLAATKFPYLIIMTAPVNIIFIAVVVNMIMNAIAKMGRAAILIQFFVLLGMVYIFLDHNSVFYNHYDNTNWIGNIRTEKIKKANLYRKLAKVIPQDVVIVYFTDRDDIDCMFYTDNLSYPPISETEFKQLTLTGRRILFMTDTVPQYAKGNTQVSSMNEIRTKSDL
jgi:4-amino-4-deoxy-L-arabinose transferase